MPRLFAPPRGLVQDLVVEGLTGAAAGMRLVGATASGAPVSGTFEIGDAVVDLSGSIWICTVAGSPGTWVEITGRNGVIDYVKKTDLAFALANSDVALTGLAKTVTLDGNTPVEVEAFVPVSVVTATSAMTARTRIGVWEDLATDVQLNLAESPTMSSSVNVVCGSLRVRALLAGADTPSAGSHTYYATGRYVTVTGTPTGGTMSSNPAFPANLVVRRA